MSTSVSTHAADHGHDGAQIPHASLRDYLIGFGASVVTSTV